MSTKNIALRALVPGLPHLLRAGSHEIEAYKPLLAGFATLRKEMAEKKVKRVFFYSTQWIAVLGQLLQARKQLKGLHVDENWYDYGDLAFDFNIDTVFAGQAAEAMKAKGFQTQLVDYEGFPVDTATIVASRLLGCDSAKIETNMLACNVYTDFEKTFELGQIIGKALAGDRENVPTAVIAVSGLSGRFFTTEIDLREDHIRSSEDESWNKKMLDLLTAGKFSDFENHIPAYASACKVDMGLKAYGFLKGIGWSGSRAEVLGYGPIYGTGAAVLRF